MKRGPYKQRAEKYEEARRLRQEDGLGYRCISSEIGVGWVTVRNWVKDIPAPNAHRLASDAARKPLGELKSKGSVRAHIKRSRLPKCTGCGLGDWLGKPLVLEVDHIDGNPSNNAPENLRLLCPNCHSQTPTWKNRKRDSL